MMMLDLNLFTDAVNLNPRRLDKEDVQLSINAINLAKNEVAMIVVRVHRRSSLQVRRSDSNDDALT